MHKSFKVFRVSENTNSFGLKQFYAMSKDGVCFRGCANSLNIPNKGDIINLKQEESEEVKGFKNPTNSFDFISRGYELAEILDEIAPKEVIEEAWA